MIRLSCDLKLTVDSFRFADYASHYMLLNFDSLFLLLIESLFFKCEWKDFDFAETYL